MRQTLDDLYAQLEHMQKQYTMQLEAMILKETSAFQRIQMKDMLKLIALDMDSQNTLQTLDDLLAEFYLEEAAYLSFLHDVTIILHSLQGCNIPTGLSDAYIVLGEAVQSSQPLHMRDVFTCISITLLAVSLCIPSLSILAQQEIIKNLDDLLLLKTKQLTLIKQRAQQTDNSSDYSPPLS